MRMRGSKIANSKLGAPRFPFESQAAGNGYAADGKVITYKLTPEEVAARYGPPKARDHSKDAYSAKHIREVAEACETPEEAALELKISVLRLKQIVANLGINAPWKQKEAGKDMGTKEAFDKALTKEKYLELKSQGLSDAKILAAVGLPYNGFINYITKAKKEWGISGIKVISEKQVIPANEDNICPSCADASLSNDYDEEIFWITPMSRNKKKDISPMLRVCSKGITLNVAASTLLGVITQVRIGVTKSGKIILTPDDDERGTYKMSRDKSGRNGMKCGGGGLLAGLQENGAEVGYYRLDWNEAKGRFETGDKVVTK